MNKMFLRKLTLGLAAGILLSGCGGSGSATNESEPTPEAAGLLRKVNNADELEASIKSGFTTIRTTESLDTTAGAAAPADSYSGTYTQEIDVDEFDAVKYDGEYLFVAPMRRQFPCCFFPAPELGPQQIAPPPAERSIRILVTDPATAEATEVANIPLADEISVQGLYRTDNRLVAITTHDFYGSVGNAWAGADLWTSRESGLSIYDTTDIAQPALLFEASYDGVFVESRRVGDTVYVVSRFTPSLPGLIYTVTTAAAQAANAAALNGVSLGDMLPAITVNGQQQSLVTPENCYVTTGEPPAYAVITSITAIPISNPAAFTTTCYNEDAYGIYVSESAMYLAQSRSDGQSTRLHKFALRAGAPVYAGSADIDGIVWTDGQADFRLSEKDGLLRVFASKFDSTAPDFIDHFLYVLRESTVKPELELVSRLPNDNRPEEIGKPNEQLYGVRFIDDRVYAVTYERLDPLYVIDLANPADPFIAGTLEITGFSDFLHPVNTDLLLGIGRSDDNALKLELFDVSNIAQPLSLDSDVLGGRGSGSEAQNDRHAFTYLANVDGVDRFMIPADLTADDGSTSLVETGLYLYEIRDKDTPALASLNRVGSAVVFSEGSDATPYFSFRSRSVLHDDAVYYIRNDEIYSLLWSDPQTLTGPL